jgi:5-methylcytosine-specific restriction endonuclease McrA
MTSFPLRESPKPVYGRKQPKRGVSGKFSPDTKQRIFERDNGQCVRCKTIANLEHTPHHILFKSQLGKGTMDNGVTICRSCHGWAHACREGREWFEQYRNKYLLLEEAL